MIDQVIGDGRYRVGRLVGRGGMAHVRLGLDVRTGRAVAVKYLLDDFLDNADARRLFAAEASVTDVAHPAVVRVLDSGEVLDPDTGASVPYLVMDFVPGQTLRALLREGAVGLDRALDLSIQLLAALAHCHAEGLVHRDIKPSNIMVTPAGRVRLLDFGVARRIGQAFDPTDEVSCFASTAYASPEQIERQPADGRSDLYSAGCVLYEMLTGRPPFAPSSPETLHLRLVEDLVPPSRHNPEVGADLDDVVLRSLRRDPGERQASAEVLSSDLENVQRARLAPAMPPVPVAVPAPPIEPEWAWTRTAVVRPPRRSPRRRLLTVTSGVAAALLPVAGFGMLHQPSGDVADAGAVAATLVTGPDAVGPRSASSGSVAPSTLEAPSGTGAVLTAVGRVCLATSAGVPEQARTVTAADAVQAPARVITSMPAGSRRSPSQDTASTSARPAQPAAQPDKPTVNRPASPRVDRPIPPAPKPPVSKPTTPKPAAPKPDKPKPTVPKGGKAAPHKPKTKAPKAKPAKPPKVKPAKHKVKPAKHKAKPAKPKGKPAKPKAKPSKPKAKPPKTKPAPKPDKPKPDKPRSAGPKTDEPKPDKPKPDRPGKPEPKGRGHR